MPNDETKPELQKLKDLSAKIQRLMREADVAGTVNLQGKEFAEFALFIEPSWSCMKFGTHNGEAYARFTCKLASGTPEEKEKGRLTMGMLHGLLHVVGIQFDNLHKLRGLLSSKMSVVTNEE